MDSWRGESRNWRGGSAERYTNDSQDELEIDGHCYRRALQLTSNKEIQRILEIKEDGDEIIEHLTHSLEIYGRWESQTNTSTSEKTGRI